MKVAIIDYGAGNIQSVRFALERLGVHPLLSRDPEEIRNADRVIFPGVGAAGAAMKKLRESGLDSVIPELKQPVLGICLGMQLLCAGSEENETTGLGIFDTRALRFQPGVKVPHMGWNTIQGLKTPLFEGVDENTFVYSVHSYYVPKIPDVIAVTNYQCDYSAAISKDNFYGVQFHPEKSGPIGNKILSNFINLN